MPIWIPEYITNGTVESTDDQTLMKDLPKSEQISMLMLEIRMTNSATVYNNYSILDDIDKIEVIADGNKVLFSCEPEMASYAAFVQQNGVLPDHRFFDGASAVTRLHLPIYFGRHPWDEEYLLDTGRYKSVQVWIDYSLNTTYFATGTFTHTISYWRPLTPLSVRGFVRTRHVKAETLSAATQTIRHDLPTTYPWHLVAVRVDDKDADINTDLTKVELNIDSGRLLLLNVDADEIYYENFRKFAHANAYVNQPVVTGSDTDVHTFGEWAYPRSAVPVVAGDRVVGIINVAGEQCDIYVYKTDGAAATDAIAIATDFRSPMPHKCMTLFDGRKTPFPAPNYQEAWVEYDAAAYAMTLTTFIQELVPGSL